MYDQVTANKRRSWLLIAGFVLLVALVAAAATYLLGLGGPVGVVLALIIAGGTSFAAYWKSDSLALAVSRAKPATVEEYPRYHNLVEGLCIASGLPKPRLYVVDDPAPNAFATGRNPRHAAVAVTTGLLEKMNRIELEAVLAHELSHIKNYDILVSTLAVTMACVVAVRFAVSRRRETLADVSGIEMTRYPPGLISALEKLRDDSTVVASTSKATAHLWMEEPAAQTHVEGKMSRINRWFSTHPPIDERIALLREM